MLITRFGSALFPSCIPFYEKLLGFAFYPLSISVPELRYSVPCDTPHSSAWEPHSLRPFTIWYFYLPAPDSQPSYTVSSLSELTTSRMELICAALLRISLFFSSDLSFLNRNFRKYLKCSSGFLLQVSTESDAQPTDFTSLFYWLSKRCNPAFLHVLPFALWALRAVLYHSTFLVPAFTRAGFQR